MWEIVQNKFKRSGKKGVGRFLRIGQYEYEQNVNSTKIWAKILTVSPPSDIMKAEAPPILTTV